MNASKMILSSPFSSFRVHYPVHHRSVYISLCPCQYPSTAATQGIAQQQSTVPGWSQILLSCSGRSESTAATNLSRATHFPSCRPIALLRPARTVTSGVVVKFYLPERYFPSPFPSPPPYPPRLLSPPPPLPLYPTSPSPFPSLPSPPCAAVVRRGRASLAALDAAALCSGGPGVSPPGKILRSQMAVGEF